MLLRRCIFCSISLEEVHKHNSLALLVFLIMESYREPCNKEPTAGRKRNQSEIALTWWDKKRTKRDEFMRIQEERDKLLEEVNLLKAETNALKARNDSLVSRHDSVEAERNLLRAANETLERDYATLTEAFQRNVEDSADFKESMNAFTQPLQNFGGFRKITDKTSRVLAVGGAIIGIMSVLMYKTKPITRLRTICQALFENAIFGVDATKAALSEMYKKHFFKEQRSLFAAWRVLRAIDLSAVGGLNYNRLETLRGVEDLEKYQRGVLPSRSSVQRAAYELHNIGQNIIPFERKECNMGEMFQYDYELFLRFILTTFQLDEIAQTESVELSITLDGAELCDGISHLTAGIKVTDSRAIDPRDGSPLCTVDDATFGRIFHNQSRNYCFAMKSLIGKDSKRAYKQFSDFFQFFERVKKFGLPASELGPRIMPMEIWSPQDLSSIWKCLNTGSGARKNGDTHFCHLCACSGNSIVRFLVDENRYSLLFKLSFVLLEPFNLTFFYLPCFQMFFL